MSKAITEPEKLSQKLPIYIITPVYNRRETTLAYLAHLERCGDLQRYHVVIVDDGSTDGTAEAIRDCYREVVVLPGSGDLWWTGAMALGMQYAYDQGADYFFWINDDCLPAENALSRMESFMRQQADTLVSASFYTAESTAPVRVSGFQGRQSMLAGPSEIVEVDGVSGWCVGIPRAVFSKIGPPNAWKFPHYNGDSMYTLAATRAGFKACILGDAIAILVEAGASRGDLSSVFNPDLSLFQSLSALFWSKKSPFRLPTQFFYQTARYGILLGTPLFVMRALSWLGKWIKLQTDSRLKARSFNPQEHA
ncbi:MAG: glycosyltransferase family 2 protein [Cyanobacteria bacterium P01_D01_bin.56]